jgi:hypothetical protein
MAATALATLARLEARSAGAGSARRRGILPSGCVSRSASHQARLRETRRA